ncbi:Protein CBG01403 [Caenorhabditis briggsae]|uniref:Protein CBG01403 n=1 Tax=Caenorhabditis briggsae TaxID=6238 RepID=A8WQC1_CAEBR|nr:Protein CBG01403 [Caenorhabditis briggsae]CAP22679.1 Protein CBG01403 [Caenorhabditis briggsae]
MIQCPTDDTYLASPEFLSFALHTLTCISLPLHVLGFYCILEKTPKTMGSVKLLLLNIHTCGFFLDILITILGVPYGIFPAMAGYGLGFVDLPGLCLYLIVMTINAISVGIFLIFENRFFILFAENSWWRHFRKPVFVASYAVSVIYFLPAQFLIPEQEGARKFVWESLGCQPVLPTHRNLFVLSLDYSVIARSIFIACGMVQIEMNVFFWLNVYYLMIAKPSTKISQRTQQLQKKLVKALFVQGIATIDLFAIPIATVVYIMNVWYHNQAINNLVFVGLAFHGTASSLIMIFIHKPYRDFVLSPFVRLKVPNVLVGTKRSPDLGFVGPTVIEAS